MAVLNQRTSALHSEHCWEEKGGVRFCGSMDTAQPDGWHREGLLSTGELPHHTEENPLQSGKQVSGLYHNRGEENNWHLLSSHLIFSSLKCSRRP